MFSSITHAFLCSAILLITLKTCACDSPSLVLYSPGEVDYTDVLVKKQHEELTLVCEIKQGTEPRRYVWNYLPPGSDRPVHSDYTVDPPLNPTVSSKLVKHDLQLNDSGVYMCSSLPHSVSKYILVQSRGPTQCARGAFWCGSRCVLASYVCDGFSDCLHGEDEDPALCTEKPCAAVEKLNCSNGRCISSMACCARGGALCRQPRCCDEHAPYALHATGYVEVEYPPLYEDRHAPDEYGFIQSTIYTVTACALIFMIAVVLLVSAICKMHMKRTALRSYARAERDTAAHYTLRYAQNHRFPPCYEESLAGPTSPLHSPHVSPIRQALQCNTECRDTEINETTLQGSGFGLARLSAIFNSRYRQVPSQCLEVEMRSIHLPSPPGSPTPTPNPPVHPTAHPQAYCPPSRQLTLHLGRFQVSIPRLGRSNDTNANPGLTRPATPDVPPTDGDTYTLNGRTIRLLGGHFAHCPPPYAAALRCKTIGPPPHYLSREVLDTPTTPTLDLPPSYDDLNGNYPTTSGLTSIIDNLPAIDSDVNANEPAESD